MDRLQHKKNRCQKSKKRNKGKRVECILPLGITQCSLPCTYKRVECILPLGITQCSLPCTYKRVECILPLGITQCSLPCTYKSRKSEKAKKETRFILLTSLLYLITDQHPIQINLQKGSK